MKEKHTYHPVDAGDELQKTLRVNPFAVPDGYFDNLHQQVLRRHRDREAARTAFMVPSGYFETLTERITAQIAEQQLKRKVSESGFSVPEGYFSDLEEQLRLEATLRGHAEETGFSVPAAYFDGVQAPPAEQATRKVAPIRRISRPKWPAYAAAACAVLAAGAVFFFNSIDNDNTVTGSQLGSVPDQEILHYLEVYGTANDMIYISEHLDDFNEGSIGEGLSEEDIEAYLNHTL